MEKKIKYLGVIQNDRGGEGTSSVMRTELDGAFMAPIMAAFYYRQIITSVQSQDASSICGSVGSNVTFGMVMKISCLSGLSQDGYSNVKTSTKI